MRLAIVADAGPGRGLGHVGRCLALAQGLWKVAQVRAVFHVADPHARQWIAERGFPVRAAFSEFSDTLIVDSYRLPASFYRKARQKTNQLLKFDDLGGATQDCDWILNSSPGAAECDYSAAPARGFLLGPRFHPLRQEFWPAPRKHTFSKLKRILIVLGGGAHRPLLERLIALISTACPNVTLDVVIGPMEKNNQKPQAGVNWHVSPPSIRALMDVCTVAISGAGQTLYELARMGVPTLAIQVADNQALNVKTFLKAGTCVFAGKADDRQLDHRVQTLLMKMIKNPRTLQTLSQHGIALVDGLGALRIAKVLMAESLMPVNR